MNKYLLYLLFFILGIIISFLLSKNELIEGNDELFNWTFLMIPSTLNLNINLNTYNGTWGEPDEYGRSIGGSYEENGSVKYSDTYYGYRTIYSYNKNQNYILHSFNKEDMINIPSLTIPENYNEDDDYSYIYSSDYQDNCPDGIDPEKCRWSNYFKKLLNMFTIQHLQFNRISRETECSNREQPCSSQEEDQPYYARNPDECQENLRATSEINEENCIQNQKIVWRCPNQLYDERTNIQSRMNTYPDRTIDPDTYGNGTNLSDVILTMRNYGFNISGNNTIMSCNGISRDLSRKYLKFAEFIDPPEPYYPVIREVYLREWESPKNPNSSSYYNKDKDPPRRDCESNGNEPDDITYYALYDILILLSSDKQKLIYSDTNDFSEFNVLYIIIFDDTSEPPVKEYLYIKDEYSTEKPIRNLIDTDSILYNAIINKSDIELNNVLNGSQTKDIVYNSGRKRITQIAYFESQWDGHSNFIDPYHIIYRSSDEYEINGATINLAGETHSSTLDEITNKLDNIENERGCGNYTCKNDPSKFDNYVLKINQNQNYCNCNDNCQLKDNEEERVKDDNCIVHPNLTNRWKDTVGDSVRNYCNACYSIVNDKCRLKPEKQTMLKKPKNEEWILQTNDPDRHSHERWRENTEKYPILEKGYAQDFINDPKVKAYFKINRLVQDELDSLDDYEEPGTVADCNISLLGAQDHVSDSFDTLGEAFSMEPYQRNYRHRSQNFLSGQIDYQSKIIPNIENDSINTYKQHYTNNDNRDITNIMQIFNCNKNIKLGNYTTDDSSILDRDLRDDEAIDKLNKLNLLKYPEIDNDINNNHLNDIFARATVNSMFDTGYGGDNSGYYDYKDSYNNNPCPDNLDPNLQWKPIINNNSVSKNDVYDYLDKYSSGAEDLIDNINDNKLSYLIRSLKSHRTIESKADTINDTELYQAATNHAATQILDRPAPYIGGYTHDTYFLKTTFDLLNYNITDLEKKMKDIELFNTCSNFEDNDLIRSNFQINNCNNEICCENKVCRNYKNSINCGENQVFLENNICRISGCNETVCCGTIMNNSNINTEELYNNIFEFKRQRENILGEINGQDILYYLYNNLLDYNNILYTISEIEDIPTEDFDLLNKVYSKLSNKGLRIHAYDPQFQDRELIGISNIIFDDKYEAYEKINIYFKELDIDSQEDLDKIKLKDDIEELFSDNTTKINLSSIGEITDNFNIEGDNITEISKNDLKKIIINLDRIRDNNIKPLDTMFHSYLDQNKDTNISKNIFTELLNT